MNSDLEKLRQFVEEMKDEGYPDSSCDLRNLIDVAGDIVAVIVDFENRLMNLRKDLKDYSKRIFELIGRFQDDRAGDIISQMETAGYDVCTVCGHLDKASEFSLYLGEDMPWDEDEPARYCIVRVSGDCRPSPVFTRSYKKVTGPKGSLIFEETSKPVIVTFGDERYEHLKKAENRKFVLDQLAVLTSQKTE